MLKYDYFSALRTLTDNSREAVELACKRRAHSHIKIGKIRGESYKTLCELEVALFSEFLPPLDRTSIAEYAHALCSVTDSALIYSRSSALQYAAVSQKGFESACASLCEILRAGCDMLDRIKKSSETPRLEEFREIKSRALESVCEGTCGAQIFAAARDLLFAISDAFDALLGLILKSI